jgi:predicted dehydrogenase
MDLRAVVIGTGWAGEGHTHALRDSGVEVIALCGRTPEPAKAMATKLGIQDLRLDWKQALEELRPDIVAIATTAAPHREMAEFAAQLGCHLLCDKPLGLNASEARAMLAAVEQADLKHAYAASSCYDPTYLYAKELIASNLVGTLHDIESMMYFRESPMTPFTWFHSVELGGGLMNNALTHKLAQICRITDGRIVSATGEARRIFERAPVGKSFHDFRESFDAVMAPEEVSEWREVTADFAYTVLISVQMPDGTEASALCKASSLAESRQGDYLTFYGDKGTLHLSGAWRHTKIEHFDFESGEWRELTVPNRIIAAVPQLEDFVQRDWNQLCREFVADIRGSGATTYPTFYDGWIHNQVIDAARNNQGWTPIISELGLK